ncbi:MAG: DedA family protein [Parachlamydiaceae bacterium]
MDVISDHSVLQLWLIDYGSAALFFLLVLGIIALPVPEETLLVVAGALMHHGELQIPHTIIAAIMGSVCGITSSYFLGWTTGHFLVERYGKWIGIGQAQIDKGHAWFERFGKWTLFIGYFIPGIRHFTGFCAGMTSLAFREFALFAYSGAILWVSTFLSVGYFFGGYWSSIFEKIEFDVDDILTIGILLGLVYCAYLLKKRVKKAG